MPVTYKDLFQQVIEQIQKYSAYPDTEPWRVQTSKTNVNAPVAILSAATAASGTGELATTLSNLLNQLNPPSIKSGLTVQATDPRTNKITIAAGEGVVGSKIFSLNKDKTIEVPFDNVSEVLYVNLFSDGIQIEIDTSVNKLTIAKIIIPKPGITSIVKDNANDDDIWDAYIINLKEYVLHGDAFGNLEEDSIELLRNNIGDILADNLIGNIRLSEDLKIINTSGSVEIDSASLKIKDSSENILAKFNRNGVFLFDENGIELAKFTGNEARIGNIQILKNALQSENFVSGSTGFQILDTGDVEFNNLTVRGTIYATAGSIGGFTIAENKLYGTTTGTIQTAENVASGANGVVLDVDGLRGYDATLGNTFNLPTDGSAPTFSSGIINSTIFEIQTNAILRTSETVGDGSANSAGLLINNTGLYGCGANQTLAQANLKALIDGTIRLSGEIQATSGDIGGVTITPTKLSGGLIEGSTIRSGIIETSDSLPKIRIDNTGIFYQVTSNIGKYGPSSSGEPGFQYGDGTRYGAGVLAYLFKTNLPPFSVLSTQSIADIRLVNRGSDPSGTAVIGDLACVGGKLSICTSAGTPGIWTIVGTQS